MTFLPIVDRELRVAARRRDTYWIRAACALGAIIVGAGSLVVSALNPTVSFGMIFFRVLSGLAMGYSLLAGRQLTADCLSAEKREGTLGLLFLTDLKGFDVVLGKLAATSVNGLYGLLAVVPMLSLPLLTGGITNDEFWRMALVLLNAFLFSLSIGIFASAVSREFKSAMAWNFYLMLWLAGALPACDGMMAFLHPAHRSISALFFPCPIYPLTLCFEDQYKLEAGHFWWSMGVIHGLTWLLVGLACWLAPRTWQDQPFFRRKETRSRQREAAAAIRGDTKSAAFRKTLLDVNGYFWRAGRPRLKPVYVWALVILIMVWMGTMAVVIGNLDETVALVGALLLNGSLKLWITLEAGTALAEDQKAGAFELLLSTPLTERDILRGQWLALRRQFLKPMLLVMALELHLMWAVQWHRRMQAEITYTWLAGIIMLAADAVALSLVAMAAALTAKNHTLATVRAVRRILIMPWVWLGLIAFANFAWRTLFGNGWTAWDYPQSWWFGIGMVVDAFWGWRAWQMLTRNFRELALR